MVNLGQIDGREGGGHQVSPAQLDADYESKGRALGRDNDRKSAFYGPAGGPIGPLGIAFALHRYLLSLDGTMTAPPFGERFAGYIRRAAVPVPENMGTAHLRGWVQPSRPIALPDPKHAPLALAALRTLAEEYVYQVGAEDRKLPAAAVAALSQSWKKPSDLFIFLRTGPEQERWTPNFEAIDPTFKSKPPPLRDPDHATLVSELKDFLRGDIALTKIIWIHDPPYSGKRRVLRHLLSQILIDETFIEPRPGERLELFARANCTSIEQVIFEIALFLGVQIPASHLFADRTPMDDLDWLLEKIAEFAAKGDKAYILANVPSVFEPLQSLVRNETLQRLIAALFAGGAGNRIIITSSDSVSSNPYISQEIFPDIPRGVFHEKRLRPPDVKPKNIACFLQAFGLAIDGFQGKGEKQIDGPLAGLLETLLEQETVDPDTRKSVVLQALQIWDQIPAEPKLLDISSRGDLCKLAELIYDQVQDPGQQQILRFVSTSEDGLRLSSLDYLIARAKRAAAGRKNSVPGYRAAELAEQEQLEVRGKAQKLRDSLPRICNIRQAGPWPLEDPPDRIMKEPEVEFLAPYRRVFEYMFLSRRKEEVDQFRVENSLTAQLIHEAARWARINANTLNASLRQIYIIRVAQGLLRSLISLDPNVLGQEHDVETEPSSESSARREAQEKFRYLFFEVFRKDIDRGHRLSVEYQKDAMRLIILLTFCSVGWPVYVGDHWMSRRPFRSWDVVQKALTVNDCIELLISIAISSARAGVWQVLEEAVLRAEVLIGKRDATSDDAPFDRPELQCICKLPPVSIQRIYRRYIDFATLTCGRQTSAALGRPFRDLSQLKRYVERLDREFEECLAKAETPENISATIRMKAALGEVLTMKGDPKGANSVFKKAYKLELRMLSNTGDDPRAAKPGPALSGQAARRYMWFLCELAGGAWGREKADSLPDRDTCIRLVRDFQDVNLRRLPRHRGEFPSILLGEAAIAVLDRNWLRAERLLLDRLSEKSHTATTSLTSGIYVDVLSARLALDLLALARMKLRRREDLISRIKILIERILRVTHEDAQDFPIFHIEAQLLAVRFILQHRGAMELRFKSAAVDPAAQLLSARSSSQRIGYGLRQAEIEFWLRRLDRQRLKSADVNEVVC